MKWSDVGELVKEGAPVLAAVLTAPASVPIAIISLLTASLGLKSSAKPEEVYQAIKNDPEALNKLAQLQSNYFQELSLAYRESMNESNNIRHEMFKEYAIENKFKSYWRPAFGYMIVVIIPTIVIWLLFMGTFVFFVSPLKLTLLESILTLILPPVCNLLGWCIGVLGVNIFHRSQDKARILGTDNNNIFSTVKDFLKRK